MSCVELISVWPGRISPWLLVRYYNLGLAYTLSMMYEESAIHYGNASEVLELRIKNIKARIEEATWRSITRSQREGKWTLSEF